MLLNYSNNTSLFIKELQVRNFTFVMNKVRGGRVPGDGMLTHEMWRGPDPPVDPPLLTGLSRTYFIIDKI